MYRVVHVVSKTVRSGFVSASRRYRRRLAVTRYLMTWQMMRFMDEFRDFTAFFSPYAIDGEL